MMTGTGSFMSNVIYKQQASLLVRLEEDPTAAEVTGHASQQKIKFNRVGNRGDALFIPEETGWHKLNVYHGKNFVTGFPTEFYVYPDLSKVFVKCPELCRVSRHAHLQVDCSESGQSEGEIQVEACPPKGSSINLVMDHRDGKYTTSFIPTDVGDWKISAYFNRDPIPSNPYTIKVYDPAQVKIIAPDVGMVKTKQTFKVDATRAGSGETQISVFHNMSEVTSFISRENNGLYKGEFTPEDAGPYNISVCFNDEEVPGSPRQLTIFDPCMMSVNDMDQNVHVHQLAWFTVDTFNWPATAEYLHVHITAQRSGNYVPYNVVQESRGYRVEYTPVEVGEHKIQVKYSDREIRNSPYTQWAYDTDAIIVTSPSFCFLGKSTEFTIDARNAGIKFLEIRTKEAGFVNTAAPETTGRIIIASLDINSPTNDKMEADSVNESGGQYIVEWTPRKAGQHRVDIQIAGRRLKATPFFVHVIDLSRIRVHNFWHDCVDEPAGFSVNFSEAVSAIKPEVQLRSPSGSTEVLVAKTLGQLEMEYTYIFTPVETGNFKIYVTYGGFDVPGCPFTIPIDDGIIPKASGDGLHIAQVDKRASFIIYDFGKGKSNIQDLGVNIKGPTTISRPVVDKLDADTIRVAYTAQEIGVFEVALTWKHKVIPGSPYHPNAVDARNVKPLFDEIKLVVGESKQLSFDISEAGPGTMEAKVSGPSGYINALIYTHTHGIDIVGFTPEEKGSHYIYVYWSEEALKDSPFWAYAVQPVPCHPDSKLILQGWGLEEAVVNEVASFTIDGKLAVDGTPNATLTSKNEVVIARVAMIGEKKFECSYTPAVTGVHLLRIKWNDCWLNKSPFTVNVTESLIELNTPDASKVRVHGPGIQDGYLATFRGSFVVDTTDAGKGHLTVKMLQPNDAFQYLMQPENIHAGTNYYRYTPTEIGNYRIIVQWSGVHVPGSPFSVHIRGMEKWQIYRLGFTPRWTVRYASGVVS